MSHDPSRDSSGTVGHRGSGSSDGETMEENPRTKEMMQGEGQEMEVTRTFHEAFVILQEDVNSFLEALERFEAALIEDLEERKRRITSGINGYDDVVDTCIGLFLRHGTTRESKLLRTRILISTTPHV